LFGVKRACSSPGARTFHASSSLSNESGYRDDQAMMTRDGSRHPANADSSDISVVGKVQQNIPLRGRTFWARPRQSNFRLSPADD
jgi:hypothetical protein